MALTGTASLKSTNRKHSRCVCLSSLRPTHQKKISIGISRGFIKGRARLRPLRLIRQSKKSRPSYLGSRIVIQKRKHRQSLLKDSSNGRIFWAGNSDGRTEAVAEVQKGAGVAFLKAHH